VELDKNIEQEIAGLLADPEKVSVQHTAMLNDLLQEYPYYQPLHLLLAKASQNAEQNNALAKASLYTNGSTLHRFLFEKREIRTNFQLNEVPAEIGADLPVVTDEQETFEEISEPYTVASYEAAEVSATDLHPASAEEDHSAEEDTAADADIIAQDPAVAEEEYFAEENTATDDDINAQDAAAADEESGSEGENPANAELHLDGEAPSLVTDDITADSSPAADEQETFEEISETLSVIQSESIIPAEQDLVTPDAAADEQETFEEISESPAIQNIPPPTEQDIPAEELSAGAEENVFEEIGEIDYESYRPFRNNIQSVPAENTVTENSDAGYTGQETEPDQLAHIELEKEQIQSPQTEYLYTKPAQPGDKGSEISAQNNPDLTGNPEADQRNYTYHNPETAVDADAAQIGTQEPEAQKNALEDDFVFESIVSTDFFAFENNFSTVEEVGPEKPEVAAPPIIEEHDEAAAAEVANSTVSNYDDDKLPYTFLWWLAKTRKEHQSSFQPYAAVKKPGSQELQQQYVEHIFHLQSHLATTEELPDTSEPAKPLSKDFQIIDSFIKNDPQIHPPNAEQIDNENKAKKSAEDQNDLVSETLAGIYIEQMLYDKAIDTYEKLSLKFPEKSRYFADLIQSIEKKI
jgi:hypothetical protein